MPNYFFATDSQTAEDLRNEVLTSTTRKLGNNFLHETQASRRRQKGIKEELSRRIRLMQKIPDSHPREIFIYNDKGYKSFTPEVEDILTRDLLRKPQKRAVPKYLDYTRGMLKDEIEKGKKAQPISQEGAKGQGGGDDQLKEEYEQLVEDFGAMETEHEQLIEKYRQLRKDHVQLEKEHERVLREISESKEKQAKVPEQKPASVPDMRPRDQGPKRPQVLGDKTLPPEIQRQAREAQEAQEVRERVSAQVREKEAREEEDAKIREWEEENFKKEMSKRERELQEERAARERQQIRAPPRDLPRRERFDVEAEEAEPLLPRHSIHGGLVDSEPTPQTRNQKELPQVQKIGYPNMQHYLPYQPKPASLRQANDLKSVSFDLPTKTPTMDQGSPGEQKSAMLQQTSDSKSLSVGPPMRTLNVDQKFPAEQPLAQQPPLQRAPLPQAPHRQSPIQQSPVQQRLAPVRQARDAMSVPHGLPSGTPNIGPLFPAQQKSAPLQQINESKSASFCLPTTTAQMPTDLRLPTPSSQNGPQLRISPRSREPLRAPEPRNNTTSDHASMAKRVDRLDFIRRPDAP